MHFDENIKTVSFYLLHKSYINPIPQTMHNHLKNFFFHQERKLCRLIHIMANMHCKLPTILAICLIFVAMLFVASEGRKPIAPQDQGKPIYWHGHKFPPQPWKGYYRRLGKCINILTIQCGHQLYDYIFYRRESLDNNCCLRLKKMGNLCHKQLSYTISHIQNLERWRGNIYKRSDEAYYKCAKKYS